MMKITKIKDILVESEGIEDESELEAYVDRAIMRFKSNVEKIICIADGDFVNISYELKHNVPFHRLRRITGYLVGTLDRWNNGKRAEEKDRVKHGMKGE